MKGEEYLNIACTRCGMRPTDMDLEGDVLVCDYCIDKPLPGKNPYLDYGKYPFAVAKMKDYERFLYLCEIIRFTKEEV